MRLGGRMKIRAVLGTSNVNRYGYKPRIEDLISIAENSKGKTLSFEHNPDNPPVGNILDTEIEYIAKDNVLQVTAIIELKEEYSTSEFLETIGKGGFSPSYLDGGFSIDASDGTYANPLRIIFDAYRTDEVKLYVKIRELSKTLNIPIVCHRARKHAFVQILTGVGIIIGAYFLEKVFDDIKLYEKIKELLDCPS